MVLRVLHFILGRLYFEVKGYQVERFLNLCAKNNLVLWQLTPTKDGYLFFIKKSMETPLKTLAKKANVELILLRKTGLPYFFKKNKKRKILAFSMILCVIMIFGFCQFIWEITVSGGEVYSESEILKYVTDHYYHPGTWKSLIDCNALEEHLREDYEEIAWVSCSIQGTRLHIDMKETLDRKTKQNPKKPCDIIANKSGIITKMSVKSGTPLASVGDSIKKGTTLISGLIYYYSDDFTVTQTDKIKADGQIIMRTKEIYQNKIPIRYYEKKIIKRRKQIKQIYVGSYRVDFPQKNKKEHQNILTERKSIKLGKSFYLPFGMTVQTLEEYQPEKKMLSTKEAKIKLKEQLEKELAKKEKKGIKIVHCEESYKKKKNHYELIASIIQEESVGKIRNIKKLTKKQEEMIAPTTAQQ